MRLGPQWLQLTAAGYRDQDVDKTHTKVHARRERAAGSHGSQLGSSPKRQIGQRCANMAWHALARLHIPSAASLMVAEWTMPMQHLLESDFALFLAA